MGRWLNAAKVERIEGRKADQDLIFEVVQLTGTALELAADALKDLQGQCTALQEILVVVGTSASAAEEARRFDATQVERIQERKAVWDSILVMVELKGAALELA